MSPSVVDELMLSGAFDWLNIDVDEDEHAIEMQLPFIFHMMEGYLFSLSSSSFHLVLFQFFSLFSHSREYTLVPILVGQLSFKLEATCDHFTSHQSPLEQRCFIFHIPFLPKQLRQTSSSIFRRRVEFFCLFL